MSLLWLQGWTEVFLLLLLWEFLLLMLFLNRACENSAYLLLMVLCHSFACGFSTQYLLCLWKTCDKAHPSFALYYGNPGSEKVAHPLFYHSKTVKPGVSCGMEAEVQVEELIYELTSTSWLLQKEKIKNHLESTMAFWLWAIINRLGVGRKKMKGGEKRVTRKVSLGTEQAFWLFWVPIYFPFLSSTFVSVSPFYSQLLEIYGWPPHTNPLKFCSRL